VAGIGWRLERLIDRGISGAAAAYATGAAVMALPWVLTTVVLISLPLVIGRAGADLVTAGTTVNVAYAVALLVAGPVQIVISRYAADRLYEGRLRAIEAPLCRGLAATFLICAASASLLLLALGVPLSVAPWGVALSAAVGAQWTALSVGNGLCSPTFVLGAVAGGSAVSFFLAAMLVAAARLGVSGYLFGLMSGQALTLVILMVGIFRALPAEADDRARLLPAFRDYAMLAGAGLAFNAALWADKLVAWCLIGGRAAALHFAASTIAWFSAIPCLAWVFVEVETAFHRRFRKFYVALEGGAPLAELRLGVRSLVREAARLLVGAVSVQTGVTLFLQLAAAPLVGWLGLPLEAVLPFRLLLIAAGGEAVALLGLILLYYFDLRHEALAAAASLLLAIALFSAGAAVSGLPTSAGTAVGALFGAIATWSEVFRGIRAALENTLLVQPFGVESRMRRRRRKKRDAAMPRQVRY
jgi:uncharacterized membrane protein